MSGIDGLPTWIMGHDEYYTIYNPALELYLHGRISKKGVLVHWGQNDYGDLELFVTSQIGGNELENFFMTHPFCLATNGQFINMFDYALGCMWVKVREIDYKWVFDSTDSFKVSEAQ